MNGSNLLGQRSQALGDASPEDAGRLWSNHQLDQTFTKLGSGQGPSCTNDLGPENG